MRKRVSLPIEDPFLEREAQKYETPVPSREYIREFLELEDAPVERRELMKAFGIDSPELKEAFRRRLKAMLRDGQLFKTPEGYVPSTHQDMCYGTLVIEREGEGYVNTQENQKIILTGSTLRGYFDGDDVEVQITQVSHAGVARGRINECITPVTPLVVGRLVKSGATFELISFDKRFNQNITIPKGKRHGAKNGDIVQVQILRDKQYATHVEPVGEVTEILGDFSTPGIEIQMAMRKFSLPEEFPKSVLKESQKFSPRVSTRLKDRKDLIDLPLVTIDGEDAKDFDDAVYCETFDKGFRLWVAIADVSHYVKPGSALDKEAQLRGNSTYFPGSVVPMLPESLSNELCSLKPNVPRLCMVCQMTISKNGEVKRSTFYKAVMQSKMRFTYTEVADIVNGNKALRKEYQEFVPDLEALHALYSTLHKQRQKRGAIDFETVETRILFDRGGKINSIIPTQRTVAHKMIEEAMLSANVCAAKFIQRHKKPALFRVHDRPPSEKLNALREFLAELGLDLPGGSEPTPDDFSQLIRRIQPREDKHLIETVMLRSLSQAQYTPKNIGHFGLAYGSYLHFTSPIRRYPDLLVHRTISDILQNKTKATKQHSVDFDAMGMMCSSSERRSDEASRDATMALKCHYMHDKVGQHFQGVITGVTHFGIFVELKDIYVEGLVHVTELGNDYFNFDSAHHRMIGERTRQVFRLGDSVDVTLVRVDLEGRKIDLQLRGLAQKTKKKAPSKKFSKARKSKKKKRRSRED